MLRAELEKLPNDDGVISKLMALGQEKKGAPFRGKEKEERPPVSREKKFLPAPGAGCSKSKKKSRSRTSINGEKKEAERSPNKKRRWHLQGKCTVCSNVQKRSNTRVHKQGRKKKEGRASAGRIIATGRGVSLHGGRKTNDGRPSKKKRKSKLLNEDGGRNQPNSCPGQTPTDLRQRKKKMRIFFKKKK